MAYADISDPRNRAAKRKHYLLNKEQYLERNRKARQKRIQYMREKKNVPCMDCGLEFPYYVMDFDHRDPKKKLANVGQLASFSWKRLVAEIEKCDVVCANCHRERTHGSVPLGGEGIPNPLENKQQGSTPCTPAKAL